MARIRAIKPGFFDNEDLAKTCPDARLLAIGLWTLADKGGRLEDRPERIRAKIFPYHPNTDIDALLGELETAEHIIRYSVEKTVNGSGKVCGKLIQIVNFHLHQQPHPNEKPSVIPPPLGCEYQAVYGDMGNGSLSTGNGNGKAAPPRQEKPRRVTPEIEAPFTSEAFLQSLATYKASRTRALKTESELLLYDDLREWGEAESIIALTGAAKAGHLQVLHPDKYRHNGNGNGRLQKTSTGTTSERSNGNSAGGYSTEDLQALGIRPKRIIEA